MTESSITKLSNCIKAGILSKRGSYQPAATETAASDMSKADRLKATVKRFLRFGKPPAAFLRAFFNRPVENRLTNLDARLTEQGILIRRIIEDAEMSRAAAEAFSKQVFTESERLVTLVGNLRSHVERARTELASQVGVRLDELEIKVRPLVPFGSNAVAVRLGDGYILASREEPFLVAMLADATSGGLEPGTRRFMQRVLKPGMTVVDAGANIGLLTLAAARAVGATGKVYAIEPEEAARKLLSETIKLNGLQWVELVGCGVGALAERRRFFLSRIPGHSSLFELPEAETGPVAEIDIKPLDDVISAGAVVHLVKMDVEGAEIEALEGMTRILSENREIVLVAEYGASHLARIGLTPEEWFARFESHGFQPFAIDEPTGSCRHVLSHELADKYSINIAFVRPGTKVETIVLQ